MENEIRKHVHKIINETGNRKKSIWKRIGEIIIEMGIIVFAVSFAVFMERQRELHHVENEVKEFLTGENILGIYKNFVEVVADNRDNYSREDWDEINVLYEALDNRKNAVEKDLTSSDNLKIAGLKIKYASIAATNRGGTKVKENAESKQ